ncbi:hypothetical protein MM236_01065 [Belliella sp. DSM 107340]|uniref:Uncharacterized protein n=1 Tax=Belliella calami TaxID=2923436 RepID=A0ABS9UIX1_9BACT|nr:hypothetical protein [Belliella calami]MCH7396551.1 hypothetical protein [Belliella calami]
MQNDLIEFVQKLAHKVVQKNNRHYEDVIQDTLITLFEENINEVDGNELRVNHLLTYHFNRYHRKDRKELRYGNISKFDSVEVSVDNIDANKLNDIYLVYKNQTKMKAENLELFFKIKFLKLKYKDINADTATNRKIVNRVFSDFKKYLIKNNIELNHFFDEQK